MFLELQASVYYVGTLAKTSKRFDSCTEGKPFRFRLNQGEVIKGWDNGVLGECHYLVFCFSCLLNFICVMIK